MAASSGSSSVTSDVQPTGWGPPPTPGIGSAPYPVYQYNVFYDNERKLATYEWEDGFWPTKKVRLAWRVDHWRDHLKNLVTSEYQWFAHIQTLYRELQQLDKDGDLHRTPITVRQYLLTKWAQFNLEEVLGACNNHYPQAQNIVTRRVSTPPRDALLEFIEKQVYEGENDYTAECSRNFVHKNGDI